MCNQCEENERKLLVDQQTRPTDSSKAICPPFFEEGHKKKKQDKAMLV
jgi:hypothetical protein